MTDRGTFLGRALALSAGVALLAACGGTTKLATNHSATSTTAAPTLGAGASNAAPTTGAAGGAAAGGSATTVTSATSGSGHAAASSSGTAAPASAAPAAPPAGTGSAPLAGSYRYESTDEKGSVTQLSLKVKTDKVSGGVYDQTLTISSPQGSEQNSYTWDPASGVTVSSTTLSGQQGSVTCNWKPGITQYVLPIRNGATWSSHSNCTTSLAGAPATATYDNKAGVSGYQQIQVAGQTLDTWVIQRTTVFTAKSATFDLTITTVSTEYFAPSDGETPKQLTDTKTTGSYGGRNFSQETKATIQAETLKPS